MFSMYLPSAITASEGDSQPSHSWLQVDKEARQTAALKQYGVDMLLHGAYMLLHMSNDGRQNCASRSD